MWRGPERLAGPAFCPLPPGPLCSQAVLRRSTDRKSQSQIPQLSLTAVCTRSPDEPARRVLREPKEL